MMTGNQISTMPTWLRLDRLTLTALMGVLTEALPKE